MITAKAHTSHDGSTGPPRNCSGDIYWAVPSRTPSPVSAVGMRVREKALQISGVGRFPLTEVARWSDEAPTQFVAEWLNNGGLAGIGLSKLDGGRTTGYYRITKLIGAFQDAAHVLSGLPDRLLRWLLSNDDDDSELDAMTDEEEREFVAPLEEREARTWR